MNKTITFNNFYNELISRTKDNSIMWKPLSTYSTNTNLEDLFQCANDMPDFGTNSIKFSASYYIYSNSVGTLFLIEVYHPTTDPFSGLLLLISLDKHNSKPVNLSSYYNIKQEDLVALRIIIENNIGSVQIDPEEISYFMNHFFN